MYGNNFRYVLSFLIVFCFVGTSSNLLCYNCSSDQRSRNECGGMFTTPAILFNNSRHYLTNCTGENSMCFVRSWTTRAKHHWIVQRGCYQINSDDPLPKAMTTPTRAMTCKHERLADAEYKLCFCNANWCNSAYKKLVNYSTFTIIIIVFIWCLFILL